MTQETAAAHCSAMCTAIRHRGPNDEGIFATQGLAIGMRRLSIIDVAHGHQPIFNESGDIAVVFNGEIYNHHELRQSLQRDGHHFATASDTEVLVHLYEQHGVDMLRLLRGMFAFAIWDSRERKLFIARDRIGIKPLFFWESPGAFAFASELRSLLALSHFPADLNDEAIVRYLQFSYIPDPHSVFLNVRKLPPGHALVWQEGSDARTWQYWSVRDFAITDIDEASAIEQLRRELDDAVACHMESEVPLGAFLSGGIDSSTVVALMQRHSRRPVQTFSIGFEDPKYDESGTARRVAKAIGTEHTEFIVGASTYDLFEGLVESFDEPFADSSALPTYLVARLARSAVTVTLSGDGGDELFAGYDRHLEILARRELSGPVRALLGRVAPRLPFSFFGRNRLIDLSRSLGGRYAATVAMEGSVELGGIVREDMLVHALPLERIVAAHFDVRSPDDPIAQSTHTDLMTFLPGDILTKVDRTSMAVSLEARVPLLDHKLIEFAVSLPSSLKVRDGKGKWILRRAIEGLVPEEVLTKPKQGFALPLASWMRGELRPRVEALRSSDCAVYRYASRAAVSRCLDEHLSSRRDHSAVIWRLLVLEEWLRAFSLGRLKLPTENPFAPRTMATAKTFN